MHGGCTEAGVRFPLGVRGGGGNVRVDCRVLGSN